MKEFEVLRVRTTKNENIVMFDIKINNVKIYGPFSDIEEVKFVND